MLVRGARMRASGAMQDRVLKHPKIEVHFNTAVDDAYPDGKGAMAGIHVKDMESGEARWCSGCSCAASKEASLHHPQWNVGHLSPCYLLTVLQRFRSRWLAVLQARGGNCPSKGSSMALGTSPTAAL